MQIVLATRNFKKVKEIREILKELNVEFLFLNDFPEIKEIEEKGKTFSENATLKAREIACLTKRVSLSVSSNAKRIPSIFVPTTTRVSGGSYAGGPTREDAGVQADAGIAMVLTGI